MPSDPATPQHYYVRFDPSMSDEELDEAVAAWVDEILGPPEDVQHRAPDTP